MSFDSIEMRVAWRILMDQMLRFILEDKWRKQIFTMNGVDLSREDSVGSEKQEMYWLDEH